MEIDCLLIGSYDDLNIYPKHQEYIEKLLENEYSSFHYSNMFFDLLLANAHLSQQGFKTEYILSYKDGAAKLEELKNVKIKTVVLLTSYFKSIHEYKEITAYIHSHYHECKVIIGGSFLKNIFIKVDNDELMFLLKRINADYYINRYDCLYEVNEYLCGKPIDQINNLIFIRDENLLVTPVDYSNSVHYPPNIQWDNYAAHLKEIITLQTARNCSFQCAFCAIKDEKDQYIEYDLPYLEKQLCLIEKNSSVKSIFFNDETINYPPDHFKAFLNIMINNQYHFNWFSFFRCQFLDDDLADMLQKSKCVLALLGLESGSNKQLERMNKDVTVENLKKGMLCLRKNNVFTYGLFMVGFPGENDESIEQTIRFINEAKPDFFVINQWTCEMNSSVWEKRGEYNLKYNNGKWKHDTMDYEKSIIKIKYIENHILPGPINAKNIDVNYIVHLLNRNYSIENIRNLISDFKKHHLFEK